MAATAVSYLENSVDRGAWQATVHGVAKVRHSKNTHTAADIVFANNLEKFF